MVSFIGAGPGDPELLTIKGKKLIDSADVIIYAGSLVNPQVLADAKAVSYTHLPAVRWKIWKYKCRGIRKKRGRYEEREERTGRAAQETGRL